MSGRVEVVATTDLDLEPDSVSGKVTVTAESGRVKLNTVSGSAEVDVGTLNALEVGTVSGQVKVTGAIADSASCQLNGYSGQIVLTVPPGSPGHFELQSATGSLQSDLPEIQRSSKAMEKRAVFARGEGGPRCRMENFSGKLAVRDGH